MNTAANDEERTQTNLTDVNMMLFVNVKAPATDGLGFNKSKT